MIREELTGNNDVGGSWYSLDGQRGTLCHAIILGTTGFRKPKGYRDRLLGLDRASRSLLLRMIEKSRSGR
jgi:hypothetical protein